MLSESLVTLLTEMQQRYPNEVQHSGSIGQFGIFQQAACAREISYAYQLASFMASHVVDNQETSYINQRYFEIVNAVAQQYNIRTITIFSNWPSTPGRILSNAYNETYQAVLNQLLEPSQLHQDEQVIEILQQMSDLTLVQLGVFADYYFQGMTGDLLLNCGWPTDDTGATVYIIRFTEYYARALTSIINQYYPNRDEIIAENDGRELLQQLSIISEQGLQQIHDQMQRISLCQT